MKIQVTVKPKSKSQKVVKINETTFVANVKSPALEGKANRELIELIAEVFDVPKGCVEIVRGENSRIKFLEIQK